MENAGMKNEFKRLFKEKMQGIEVQGLEKITSKECKFFLKKKEIAYLDLAYVSSKHAEYGAVFGVYAQCRATGGKIAFAIEELNLSYSKPQSIPTFFALASLSETKKDFGERGGIISIFAKDDLDERSSYVAGKLNANYIPKIINFCLGGMGVVNDILEHSYAYAYPMASIILACYLNGEQGRLDEVIASAKSKKLHDGSKEKVSEVLEKCNNYFSAAAHD